MGDSKFKIVRDHTIPDPFSHIEIDVCPVVAFKTGKDVGHSVGIMNRDLGQGVRKSLDYAEAEAKAVLAAIRKYRRINKLAFSEGESDV